MLALAGRRVVISPHLDDAIFSVGEQLAGAPATIACPFAGIPNDRAGRQKYLTLRREHTRACRTLSLDRFDGPFLDDVYPTRNLSALRGWFKAAVHQAGEVWVPLGIHHPDHILLAALALDVLQGRPFVLYEELPYRVLYPEATATALACIRLRRTLHPRGTRAALGAKRSAVESYRSQLRGDEAARCLYVPERTWWVA